MSAAAAATATTTEVPLVAAPSSSNSRFKLHGSALPTLPTLPTLRALYPRATHSFVQRDLGQTESLVDQAFQLLSPPCSPESLVDGLSSHRRKWDILRITLATTFYSSNPLQLQLPPDEFVQSLRTRSLRLFTPQSLPPSAEYVPPQIILLLAVSALKFNVVTLAREIIEDWLTRRAHDAALADAAAYEKIIEVYSLHVLARLGAWEDASVFLRYEGDLPEQAKQVRTNRSGANNFDPADPHGFTSACFNCWK
jgi:hypothetical protein